MSHACFNRIGLWSIACFSFHTRKLGLKNTLETIKNGKIEESAVAAHVWKEKHAMDHKPVLLKQTSNKQELTNWENILITQRTRW